ncbi:MAG: hypothetical protein RRZ67_02665 [Victivallaceae bacterium]
MGSFRVFSRSLLTRSASYPDQVYHIVLNNEDSDSLCYEVGGVLGVCPENDIDLVSRLLRFFSLPEEFLVHDSEGNLISVFDFLRLKANLVKISSKMKNLLGVEGKFSFYRLDDFAAPRRDFDYLNCFADLFLPLLPRLYSIASSPQVSKERLELIVRLICIQDPDAEIMRYGVCSDYLCRRAAIGSVIKAFVRPSPHFTLRETMFGKPILMIGAGTGIAPYRAFLQHRIVIEDPGQNILIFGERSSKSDFYFENFWRSQVFQDRLSLFSAFSRDQTEKVYVQDRIKEQQELVYDTLVRKEGFVFVCGSKTMGMSVRKTLQEILGKGDLESGKLRFKEIREDDRYFVDLY